ncbi:MAG: hypothetical protein GXP33_08605 [Spirochaetes bacterium]|nr:hypothetical protein [Spirochaetota bacterium]
MKVTLLGTGADHCIPAFRCACPVCRDARKRGVNRQNSAASVKLPTGEIILIDMPPQIMMMLRRYNIADDRISSVLVTHKHGDHTLGLRYLFHGSEKKGFTVEEPVNLFIPNSTYKAVSKKLLSGRNYDLFPEQTDYYRIKFIKAYEKFIISGIEIIPLETGHLKAKAGGNAEEESFGFLIKNPGGNNFAYLLDASMNLPDKTMSLLKKEPIGCLVLDCTYSHTTMDSGHFDVDGVIKIKEELKPEKMFVSHISHKNMTFKELSESLSKYFIEMSYDGLEIDL